MLGSRGPLPGVSSSSRASLSNAMPSLLSPPHQPPLHFEHSEQQPAVMDEFLDLFGASAWDMAGAFRLPCSDFNAASGQAHRLGVDPQKLFTMSLLPSGLGLGSHGRDLQDGADSAHVGESALYSAEESMIAVRLRNLQDPSSAAPGNSQQIPSIGPRGATLARSPSVGSSGSEGSGGQQSPPPIAPTWRQPYVGGVPPLPISLGQAKSENLRGESLTPAEAHLLGKRSREDVEVSARENHSASTVRDGPQGLFASFGGGQVAQAQMVRQPGQQSLAQQQQGNGSSSQSVQQGGQAVSVYGSQATATQPQASAGAGAARPRVRARRGQATDPHSIAERLRRERIAERMKALQELVPNSNKTDKASMLDEIIDYVKFLQLQVKVLSMSRLGGAGAVAPLVADLPSEVGPSNYVTATIGRSGGAPGPSQDGLALTERQVARLMEEDMGSAMQYLQSKGLCLMPISLATAISSTNSKSQSGTPVAAQGSSERPRPDPSSTGTVNNTLGVSPAPSSGMDVDSNKSGSALKSNKDSREVSVPDKSNAVAGPSSKSPKARPVTKGKEDSQRRSQ